MHITRNVLHISYGVVVDAFVYIVDASDIRAYLDTCEYLLTWSGVCQSCQWHSAVPTHIWNVRGTLNSPKGNSISVACSIKG